MKPDWIIHYVSNNGCECCGKANNPAYYDLVGFANAHTHGLDKHGHRELCIVLDAGMNRVGNLLNTLGVKIAERETIFAESIRDDVLNNGMRVKFISFDDDPTLYVMLPDPNGILPGEDGCTVPYCLQEEYAKIISKNKDYV